MKQTITIMIFVSFSYLCNAQFQCGDTLIDARDGKKYATTQIGNQCWLAENLNYGKMIISDTGGHLMTENGIVEKYVWKNNDSNAVFDINHPGAYYEHTEAIQYSKDTVGEIQGICPNGWHIPSKDEFEEMIDFLGGSDTAGTAIKLSGESGFNANYGGWRCMMTPGTFYNKYPAYKPPVKVGFYWTSSSLKGVGYMIRINEKDGKVIMAVAFGNELGMNVRCVIDKEE